VTATSEIASMNTMIMLVFIHNLYILLESWRSEERRSNKCSI